MRRGRARKRVSQEMPGPANTTRLPLGIYLAADTLTLAWVGEVARSQFIASTSAGAVVFILLFSDAEASP